MYLSQATELMNVRAYLNKNHLVISWFFNIRNFFKIIAARVVILEKQKEIDEMSDDDLFGVGKQETIDLGDI